MMMTREQQVAVIAAAMILFSAQSASAATVVETTSTGIAVPVNGSGTFDFPAVVNADQLTAISGGSVAFGEGGTFNISVNYAGGASTQIFSQSGFFNTLNLSTISNLSFAPGTITGLTFSVVQPYVGGPLTSASLPSGTSFTFRTLAVSAVPEPATWALMLFGFGAAGYSIRRKRRASLCPA